MKFLFSLFILGAGVQAVHGALDSSSNQLQQRAAHNHRAQRSLEPQTSGRKAGIARRAVCAQRSRGGDASANVKTATSSDNNTASTGSQSGCFPSAGFQMPDESSVSGGPPDNWWCDAASENGFMGFSYGLDQCQSLSQLKKDFAQMNKLTNARYVRLYSSCDSDGKRIASDVVTAAYENGLGVYALIWFGFNGDDSYKKRQSDLMAGLNSNKLTPYVLRHVDVGSETLYDYAIAPTGLASLIKSVKGQVSKWGATVAFSDMPYAYSRISASEIKDVMQAVDVVHANILPYFDTHATNGNNAWNMVSDSITQLKGYMKTAGVDKKISFTQTGWPTNNALWKVNSASAVASTSSSESYLNLLNSKCAAMKSSAGHNGVGWFWQIWSDSMLGGWGFVDDNGNPKYNNFKPVMDC